MGMPGLFCFASARRKHFVFLHSFLLILNYLRIMKKYHQLSVFKTDRVKNSFPEYFPAQLVFDLHFIARQSDIKEIAIRVYDNDLVLMGSDNRTLVPTNTFSDVNFCIGIEKEPADKPIIVYIYLNDTPRWRAELTVDRRKDVASVTTLTIIEPDSDEMYFASKVCNESWWKNLSAYSFTRSTKLTIARRIRYYNTMIESKAWTRVPCMCVASNRNVAEHLARYVLAKFAGDNDMEHVRNISLEDIAQYEDDGFYEFGDTIRACRVVTVNVERHHRFSYTQGTTVENFMYNIRSGYFPYTTFIFYGPKCHVKHFYDGYFMCAINIFSPVTQFLINEFDLNMTFMERREWIEEEERDNQEIRKSDWPDLDCIIDYHYYDGRGSMPPLVDYHNETPTFHDDMSDNWFDFITHTDKKSGRSNIDYLEESPDNEFSGDYTNSKRRKKDPLHPSDDDDNDEENDNDDDDYNDADDSIDDSASTTEDESTPESSTGESNFLEGFVLEDLCAKCNEEAPTAQSSTYSKKSTPQSDREPAQPTDNAEQKLMSMIGLERVKREISDARNMALFTQRRNRLHLAAPTDNRNHMLFLGNPGTGKTSVAKLIGTMFHEMGLLSKGHTVEANRSMLIGEYIGQTEIRTNEAIEKARGGVLFIDEAYALAIDSKNSNDFGKQALNTILPVLSEPNPDMIVIMAGYEDKIDYMLDSNQGLKERFPIRIHFDDFTADELWQIAHLMCSQQGFVLTPEADERLRRYIESATAVRSESFSNARWVHNLMDHGVVRCMANRVVTTTDACDEQRLYTTIEECDIAAAEQLMAADAAKSNKGQRNRIGFI
jgi:hypothetical protein